MLVEDDNNLREIYEARLMAEGYEIVSARDGEEALAVAVREKPDLIISDVMMPKISGFDMLDILRSTPETKNTKVIMMTALSQAEDKERAEKLGADRYLVKSQVTLEDVAKVAREVLAGDAVAVPDPPAPAAAADEPAAVPVPEPPVAAAAPAEPIPIPIAETPATPAAADPPPTDVTTADLVSASAVVIPSAESGVTDLTAPSEPAKEPAPIAPALKEDNDIEKTSAEIWGAPEESEATDEKTDDKPAAPVPDTTAAEAKVDSVSSQSLAEEEAAIAKQIESIIDNPPAKEAPVETAAEAPAPAAEEPDAPEPTPPEPTPEVAEKEAEKPAVKTGGEKVIAPLNDPSKPKGPSLDELVAKEEALEAKTGDVIDPIKSKDTVDPNNLAL